MTANIKYIEELILNSEIKKAFDFIEKELVEYSDNSELYYYKGICISTFDNFEDSLEYFTKSMKLDPDGTNKCNEAISSVYIKSANIYYHKNDFENALNLFDIALSFNNKSAGALLGKGNISYKKNDYESAIDLFNKSIISEEKYPIPYYMLGASYHKLLDYKNAEKYYLKAISIAPRFINSYIWLSKLYTDTSEPKKALDTLRSAEMLKPNDISIKQSIAGLMLQFDQFNDILKFLDSSFKLDEIKPNFYYSIRSFIRDINTIEFNDNYLTKPLNYISIESVNGKDFNSSVDKIIEISQKEGLKDFDQLSSKFFNLSTSSILYEYFSKRFLNYIETSSNGDLFFSDFDKELKLQLGIVNSSNSTFVDEITTGYAKGKGLFFFSNDFTDINNNLEIEFSYKQVQSSKYFNKSFKKNITLKNHSLILFPGLLSYKIINSNKFDLNFCTLEFNNS